MWNSKSKKGYRSTKVVTTAVNVPLASSKALRTVRMPTPRFSAYLVPKTSRFSGLASNIGTTRHKIIAIAKRVSCYEGRRKMNPFPTSYMHGHHLVMQKVQQDDK